MQVDGERGETLWLVQRSPSTRVFRSVGGRIELDLASPQITGGRRIWPEEARDAEAFRHVGQTYTLRSKEQTS